MMSEEYEPLNKQRDNNRPDDSVSYVGTFPDWTWKDFPVPQMAGNFILLSFCIDCLCISRLHSHIFDC